MSDADFNAGVRAAIETMHTAGDSAVTEALGQRLCCNGHHCGCMGATVEDYLIHLMTAQLRPEPQP